ncbi:ATP-dependent nuclease [Clostridium uliginosum]|uniref:Predicted ATP-dependent endonuclease of the OLD family, contains P-loop ATPase and TOPRIM domains n=1 Tax=Clostridium uliginosum TaxID=119641 RepID=A0A1I1P6U9_9CLOT|nr:AAA family ATPase [Clostridium uliginosum]SFD05406.1 Predicted ATP-dependent endonuclease of the OLD family, contains P-loop ATPase and TOPRIM domains [Clostridium uliginosum]
MYIYKIIIKNFRTIKLLEWKPNRDINIIIGANGSGKSTLATALDYLLNPYLQWYNKTLSEIDYYDRDTRNDILIEVWFKDVEDFIIEDGELLLEHIDKNDKISEIGEELVLITRFKGNSDRKASHTIVSNGKEQPFRQAHKGILNYKYIEAERDPLKELSFVSNSVLSKIIENDKLSDLVKSIIDDFNSASSNSLMSDTYFKESLSNLGNNFAKFDLIANDEVAIGVEATELTERKTLQSFSLVCKNKNTSNYIPLKYQSRGIKNLMLLIALQELMSSHGILFLEEPEQNLEPFMQRKIIKKVSKSNKGQLFFTTHSIEVAKVYDFDNIFLMKDGTMQNLPKPEEVDNAFETRIEKFAKRELISGLFSRGILLVEGDSELSGLPLFSQEYINGLEDSGVEIIKGDGKDNVFKYALFYDKCSVPCLSLVDNDSDINWLLNKYSQNNIKSIILCQPKDYETSIVGMSVFQECWMELFEEIYPFKKYKDNYIKPFVSKDSKSEVLKQKYQEEEYKKIKTFEELVELLNGDEIKEFQREFLHLNLAGIVNSKYVASYLIDKAEEKMLEDFLPSAFSNIFNLVGVYMGNNSVCENSARCIVNKISNNSFECTDICENCGSIKTGYKNVLQVKGDS